MELRIHILTIISYFVTLRVVCYPFYAALSVGALPLVFFKGRGHAKKLDFDRWALNF